MPEENPKLSMSRWATEVRLQTFQYVRLGSKPTYFLRVSAYYTCEPWPLFMALEEKGFVKNLFRPKNKDGFIVYRFSRRGSLSNGNWNDKERRSNMRILLGTLRKFGFNNVPRETVHARI